MKTYFPQHQLTPIKVARAENFCLVFEETPSSGYSWQLKEGAEVLFTNIRSSDNFEELGGNSKLFEPPNQRYGSLKKRVFILKAHQSGDLKLELKRNFENKALESLELKLEVENS